MRNAFLVYSPLRVHSGWKKKRKKKKEKEGKEQTGRQVINQSQNAHILLELKNQFRNVSVCERERGRERERERERVCVGKQAHHF